ncbi:MAG: crossover junction endodeoxyribonuclease RuvC [Alphaproteobacteria bacterium]
MPPPERIIGLDPGLSTTGWGLIETEGQRLRYLDAGHIAPPKALDLPERLAFLHKALCGLLETHRPHRAAVEMVFINGNAKSSLTLCHARGVVLMTPAAFGIPVLEYPANTIKKCVVGVGHADKVQVQAMIRHLLPTAPLFAKHDTADALAVAICGSLTPPQKV